ncbi:MAG: hypothetical protein ACFHWX_18355 [Bacteroidota bacterium]
MADNNYTKPYKITIWLADGSIRKGYRYLPEGKVTAMKALRPVMESQEDFYDVLGYQIQDEKELGYEIPKEKVKHIDSEGIP